MKQPAKTFNHTVGKHPESMRIDRYLSLQFPQYSRTFYQKLIENGLIKVNDTIVKPSYLVEANDSILIEIPPPEETELQPERIPLNIIYEDKHLLVINKPAGLIVHPGAGVRSGTLVNALLHHCKDLSGIGGRLRPGIVHRLDKNTSGLLVAAKNDFTHISLQKQFTEKSAHREYKALLWGILSEEEGRIET
ncbi:MAG: pseudouridine synthase, partial [Calditrichia bacterium]